MTGAAPGVSPAPVPGAAARPARQRVLVAGDENLAIRVAEELAARGHEVLREPSAATSAPARDVDAVVLCDDTDVENVRRALELREVLPDARIVVRTFNRRLGEHLPHVLGDCRVLSATWIAAGPMADLAVGAGPRELESALRQPLRRLSSAMSGSDAAAIARQLWRRRLFRSLVVAWLVLAALEALVARFALDLTVPQSLLAAATGVMTVGLADFGLAGTAVANLGWPLQVLCTAAVIADALLVAVLFGLVADAVIGERFARVFGGSTRRLRGHVIVAGLGTVGYRLVAELTSRGWRCVAIEADRDSPFITPARRLGALVTIADVRQDEELVQLGVERAAAVIAATDNDAANLEIGLTVAALAPDARIVLRMFDQELASRLEQLDEVTACRSVAALAAPSFADAVE